MKNDYTKLRKDAKRRFVETKIYWHNQFMAKYGTYWKAKWCEDWQRKELTSNHVKLQTAANVDTMTKAIKALKLIA